MGGGGGRERNNKRKTETKLENVPTIGRMRESKGNRGIKTQRECSVAAQDLVTF